MNRAAPRAANGTFRRTATGEDFVEAGPSEGPVMVIDTYLPRPGLRGAFLAGLAEGLHGAGAAGDSRVYRSLDGEAVVVVTEFRSHAEKARWRGSEAYCVQLQHLRPLLEHMLSRTCEPVAADVATGSVAFGGRREALDKSPHPPSSSPRKRGSMAVKRPNAKVHG